MTIKEELMVEKSNIINLMEERDNIKEELIFYKGLWNKLKEILNDSIDASWTVYRSSNNTQWLNFAESDKAVLERMIEMEQQWKTK